MLISHKYKIIFIHIPKNSGTFIWLNIMSKIDPDIVIILENKYQTHHSKLKDKLNIIQNKYKNYKTFCIIRNPFETLVSLYKYIKKNNNYPVIHNYVKSITFNEFVKSGLNFTDKISREELFLITNYYYQSSWIYDTNDNLLVDTIIRHENMEKELKEFLLENNVEKEIINNLDFETKINNTNTNNYTPFYNQELIAWIYIFIPDFVHDCKRFGYSFPESNPNPSK